MIVPTTFIGKILISGSVGLTAGLIAAEESEKVVVLDSATARWGAISAIAVAAGFGCQIVLQIMARMDAAKAAKKVQEVADKQEKDTETAKRATAKQDVKLDDLHDIAQSTHVLVNSQMAAQLKVNADLASRIAALTVNTPQGKDDAVAAKAASDKLADHENKQRAADASPLNAGDTVKLVKENP
jgi:hypothetical protein